MARLTEPAHVTLDRHVVGRVGEDQIGALLTHEQLHGLALAGVAAHEPVPAQEPHVPRSSYGCALVRDWRERVLRSGGCTRRTLARLVEHKVDLSQREARELDLE